MVIASPNSADEGPLGTSGAHPAANGINASPEGACLTPLCPIPTLKSTNALWKRVEQLRRWEGSETDRESSQAKSKLMCRVNFQQPCVFLAACAAGEKAEILWLLGKQVDINTANADGMTALHQACIDGSLDIVKFLHLNGADPNVQDNEGWAPIHAAASCGHLEITKYLVRVGADLTSCTTDRELALDLADNDDVATFLRDEMVKRGMVMTACRDVEHSRMLEHCKRLQSPDQDRFILDFVDPRTGATALHVAAAKDYQEVVRMLLQGGCKVDAKDSDGWTALHAAAHWDKVEVARLLVHAGADIYATTNSGHQVCDVCDDVVWKEILKFHSWIKMNSKEVDETQETRNASPHSLSSSSASSESSSESERHSATTADGETARSCQKRSARDINTPAWELIAQQTSKEVPKKNERFGRLQASLRSLSEKFKYNVHEAHPATDSTGGRDVALKRVKEDDGQSSDNGRVRKPLFDSAASRDSPESTASTDKTGPPADLLLPQKDFVASRRNRFEAVAKEYAATINAANNARNFVSPVRSEDELVGGVRRSSATLEIDSDTQSPNPSSLSTQTVQWGSCVGSTVQRYPIRVANAGNEAFSGRSGDRKDHLPPRQVNGRLPSKAEPQSKGTQSGAVKSYTGSSSALGMEQRPGERVTAVTVSSPPPLTVTANVSVSTSSNSSTPPECVQQARLGRHSPTVTTATCRNLFNTPSKDETAEAERKKRSARARRERRSTQGVSSSDIAKALNDVGTQSTINRFAGEAEAPTTSKRDRWTVQSFDEKCIDNDVSVSDRPASTGTKVKAILVNKGSDHVESRFVDAEEDPLHSQKKKSRPIQRRPTGRVSNQQRGSLVDREGLHGMFFRDASAFKPGNVGGTVELIDVGCKMDSETQTCSFLVDSHSLQHLKLKYHDKCVENEQFQSEIGFLKRELYEKDQLISKLKSIARSDQFDKRKLDSLKADNNRLKEENAALIRVISKMSKQT